MQEYKREKNALESRLQDLQKRAQYHDDHLRIVDAWFKQLIDEVKLMVQEPKGSPPDLSSLPSSLLFADRKNFEIHLHDRSNDIRAVISRIFSSCAHFSPDVTHLQQRLAQLLALEKEHVVELERHQSEKQELEDRLESASLRYMMAEKKLDRAKSMTVAKLEKQALLGAQKPGTEGDRSVKREEGMSNGVVENGDGCSDLEEAHHKMLAVSLKQKEQLEHLESENSRLTSQLTELNARSTRFTDDDYAGTDLFKQMKSQHDDIIRRINNLEALNLQLQEEAVKLQAERTVYKRQLETESQTAIGEKNTQLSAAETNLARIRSNRDELLADQAIKRSSQDQERDSLAKIRDLAAANVERIRALELENERLRVQDGLNGVQSTDLDSLDSEELRARYFDLDRKYNLLNSELSSMSTAFQRSSKLATQKISELSTLEDKVLRLTAEKAKADQKYFAAMKSKETKDSEVRTLRMQNTKSSDVVSQLKESEAASQALVATLEKQLAETKDGLSTKLNNFRHCQQQVTESTILVEGLNKQIVELKKSLSLKDTSLSTTRDALRTAERDLEAAKASLANTQKSLEAWKAKGLANQSSEEEMLRVSIPELLPG